MNHARRSIGWAALVLLLAAPLSGGAAQEPPAGAAEPAGDAEPGLIVTLGGYGTLGVVHSSERRADFLANRFVADGAGYSRSWSPKVDSRVGVQVLASFRSRLSAVLQMVAEQGADGAYTPQLEWANVKVQVTPEASLRAGRIVLPSFMVSDSRKVGFANVWVRPPAEVYALVSLTASDGLDASYRFHTRGSTHTLQANYGQADKARPGGDQIQARRVWGATATSERGPATIRAAYLHARVSDAAFNRLFDAFRQLGPEGVAIAERYDVAAAGYEFLSVGGLYDPGRWFATAEWGTAHSRSAIGDRTAWYVSAGYRFAKLTPYATYADVAADARSEPGLAASAYPPELAGVVTGLNAALDRVLALNQPQSSVSVGVRWDFRANFDLKLQFDRCRLGPGSAGLLGNLQPDFEGGGRYDLISVAVDFVF